MNIQQILDAEKAKSELHKLREGRINKILANRLKGPQMAEILRGRKRGEEFSKKISEVQKGVKKGPQSEQTKEKNRQSNLGRKVSEHTRKLMSENVKRQMNDPRNKKKNSQQAKKRLAIPENNPNYKGLIYSKNIKTNEIITYNGPKDFIDTQYNYFTVLKRIKTGKIYKDHIWYRN